MIFKVWCEDYGQDEDDAASIDAISPSQAAEIWAERKDSWDADYLIVSGNPVDVFVKHGISKMQKFNVSGRQEAVYDARECGA